MKKIIAFLLVSNIAWGQKAIMDTNSMLIGEQINFSISNPISETEVWPTYNEFWQKELRLLNKES